jgi:hypothetical protein
LSSDQSSSTISPAAPAAAANVVRARRPLNAARVATLSASKIAARAVDEGARSLGAREDKEREEKVELEGSSPKIKKIENRKH